MRRHRGTTHLFSKPKVVTIRRIARKSLSTSESSRSVQMGPNASSAHEASDTVREYYKHSEDDVVSLNPWHGISLRGLDGDALSLVVIDWFRW